MALFWSILTVCSELLYLPKPLNGVSNQSPKAGASFSCLTSALTTTREGAVSICIWHHTFKTCLSTIKHLYQLWGARITERYLNYCTIIQININNHPIFKHASRCVCVTASVLVSCLTTTQTQRHTGVGWGSHLHRKQKQTKTEFKKGWLRDWPWLTKLKMALIFEINPLHRVLMDFSERLVTPRCSPDRLRSSFVPAAVRFFLMNIFSCGSVPLL